LVNTGDISPEIALVNTDHGHRQLFLSGRARGEKAKKAYIHIYIYIIYMRERERER